MFNKKFLAFTIIFSFIGLCFQPAFADTATDLQQQINDHNTTISQLQAEISQYQAELNKTTVQAKTLQGAINSLNLNSQKLNANIKLTQTQIDQTNLKIKQLSLGIDDKTAQIATNEKALAETLRNLNESDSQQLLQTLLAYPTLSTFLNKITTLQTFQTNIENHVEDLKNLKTGLETSKSQNEVEVATLTKLKANLNQQETSVELNKSAQSKLLAQTKDKESNYQQLIADRKAKEQQFEKELTQYEAQLKQTVNPNSFPSAGSGVLSWPLDAPHRVTQLFGNTAFSATHAQVYSGKGHNGIDIAAPIGTPIYAALNGIVEGTGNTDLTCPGASFGQWVLIQHPDGLSSLYAHLSLIKAYKGEQVGTGDIIGYSGMTGYATGPHLHFTVYATDGVQVMSRPSAACNGAVYTMPIAQLSAYLNPLSYLIPDSSMQVLE